MAGRGTDIILGGNPKVDCTLDVLLLHVACYCFWDETLCLFWPLSSYVVVIAESMMVWIQNLHFCIVSLLDARKGNFGGQFTFNSHRQCS